MIPSVRKPSPFTIRRFLAAQVDRPFSYPEVGCTQQEPSSRYSVDRNRVLLGRGRETFSAACAALRRWAMFRLGWVELHHQNPSIAAGGVVAILVRANALWWLNAARIVYVSELPEGGREFAFAYGTLHEHAEQGEERFAVSRDADDNVWYEILAASRPGHWFGWAGYPLVRRLQRRFAGDSLQAMVRAVEKDSGQRAAGRGQ